MNKVFFDNNSTTPVAPEVVEAMMPYLTGNFGNPSSLHSFGREANKAMNDARAKIAGTINADPKELIFTSGGTESDNLAVRGVAIAKAKKGKHIITSSVEHHAVVNVCDYLAKEGYDVSYLPVNTFGQVNPQDVADAIRDDTILISVMTANNEVGTINPIAQIGAIAREKGVLFHTDAVQALGKMPIDVNALNVDLMSISAHKIHGPKGVGALYFRKGTALRPMIVGGHHERNRRAGTENVQGIVGFARAIELAMSDLDEEVLRLARMRDRLQSLIEQNVEHILVTGDPDNRLPNTLHVCFNFIEGEGILLNLDIKGVAASTGSACASGSLDPSHVLSAMNIPVSLAQGGIRFSLGRYNTMEEVEYAAEVVREVIPKLRQMSPLYDKYLKGELDMDEYSHLACYRCSTEE